jgi:hypothetical protein
MENTKVIKSKLKYWLESINSSKDNWEENDLHIDEIETLENVKNSEWIISTINILNLLLSEDIPKSKFLIFLHIDLKYTNEKEFVNVFSQEWLENNVNEYTPPSLHVTTSEYYNDFYLKNLTLCKPDSDFKKLLNYSDDYCFYYRTYYDKDEEMYSREIYIFKNAQHNTLKFH